MRMKINRYGEDRLYAYYLRPNLQELSRSTYILYDFCSITASDGV